MLVLIRMISFVTAHFRCSFLFFICACGFTFVSFFLFCYCRSCDFSWLISYSHNYGLVWFQSDERSMLIQRKQVILICLDLLYTLIIILIMYIYQVLINALRAHMIHINLNMIFYTHVEHSPTKTIYIKYHKKCFFIKTKQKKLHTHTHTHICTRARAHIHWL